MKYIISLVIFFLFFGDFILCQDNGYSFVIKKEIPSTPVKNQSLTSTCWSFSGISFLESELMRLGKQEYDLSEMYIVNEAYKKKAEEYARRNGSCAFSAGGQYHDFLTISKEAGLLPDQIYSGLKQDQKFHNHDEMDAALKGYMKGILKSTNPSPSWNVGLNGILEAYLGKVSEGFEYNGKYYNPKSFAEELGINFDDYITVSSFNDHPYYKESVLEVPDNWAPCTYYNLPLNEMINVIDNALMNGYSVAWAADMKGKGFNQKRGVAIVPQEDWDEISNEELDDMFRKPHPQKNVTQEIRQNEFDDYSITGDHGMHIIGIAEDQNGNVYYKVKNSWGPTGKYQGYVFVSREYVKLKTTNFLINKNALPRPIAQKMGITINQWQNGAIAESEAAKGDITTQPVQVSSQTLAQ